MKHIIVTADDYGMCNQVDAAINEGIKNSFITTTNVLVNMETLMNAAKLRNDYPNISVGIHWNVTTGRPVSKKSDVSSLVDSNGIFWPLPEFKKRIRKGKISTQELTLELENQYKEFFKYCGCPDYWNTHENSALSLKAFKIFSSVAQRFKIPSTRNFERVYFDKINLGFKTYLREFLVSIFFHFWFKTIKKDFKMPCARIVSFNKISKLENDGDLLLNALLKSKKDYIEVVLHPSITSEYKYFGSISLERVKEYELSISQTIKNKYTNAGIEFITFSDL